MEMLKVLERVLLRPTQMHSRAMYQLAEFPSLLEAVEQVERVANVALFENEFEIRKVVEQSAVNDPRDRNHVFERMSQHPPDRVIRQTLFCLRAAENARGKRAAIRPASTI